MCHVQGPTCGFKMVKIKILSQGSFCSHLALKYYVLVKKNHNNETMHAHKNLVTRCVCRTANALFSLSKVIYILN